MGDLLREILMSLNFLAQSFHFAGMNYGHDHLFVLWSNPPDRIGWFI